MPRFHDTSPSASADSRLVQHLHQLSGAQLVALVKDVEARYRKLAQFESEEIRRAQALGFSPRNLPFAPVPQTTAS